MNYEYEACDRRAEVQVTSDEYLIVELMLENIGLLINDGEFEQASDMGERLAARLFRMRGKS